MPNLTGSGRDSARRRLGRWSRRLLGHHLPLALLTCGSAAALYFTRPYRDVISRASFATAYAALALLAATLLIGPLNLLRANPVSSDLRRDVGIWAGMFSMVHAVVGQFVHLRGRPWIYYVYGSSDHHHRFRLRHDLFGLTPARWAFWWLRRWWQHRTTSRCAGWAPHHGSDRSD